MFVSALANICWLFKFAKVCPFSFGGGAKRRRELARGRKEEKVAWLERGKRGRGKKKKKICFSNLLKCALSHLGCSFIITFLNSSWISIWIVHIESESNSKWFNIWHISYKNSINKKNKHKYEYEISFLLLIRFKTYGIEYNKLSSLDMNIDDKKDVNW